MTTKGFTLLEVLAASLVASVVAGGTMMAFVTAARIGRFKNTANYAEAATLAQETFENFRNRVAADDTFFATAANPGATAIPNNNGWIADPILGVRGDFSIVETTAKRCYRVRPAECDGTTGIAPQSGDCYAMAVQVCWNNEQLACNCP